MPLGFRSPATSQERCRRRRKRTRRRRCWPESGFCFDQLTDFPNRFNDGLGMSEITTPYGPGSAVSVMRAYIRRRSARGRRSPVVSGNDPGHWLGETFDRRFWVMCLRQATRTASPARVNSGTQGSCSRQGIRTHRARIISRSTTRFTTRRRWNGGLGSGEGRDSTITSSSGTTPRS